LSAIDAGIRQINDQVKDAIIVNPLKGKVLETYMEAFEIVTLGKPLYKIANLDTLVLKVYVSGAQLPGVKLGEEVSVLIDKNEKENQELTGQIIWISDEAEFTPKIIQTKEERVDLVYAVKVKVPNDGRIKIGMPGEVKFGTANEKGS
jgi:HlyD family secretion protein